MTRYWKHSGCHLDHLQSQLFSGMRWFQSLLVKCRITAHCRVVWPWVNTWKESSHWEQGYFLLMCHNLQESPGEPGRWDMARSQSSGAYKTQVDELHPMITLHGMWICFICGTCTFPCCEVIPRQNLPALPADEKLLICLSILSCTSFYIQWLRCTPDSCHGGTTVHGVAQTQYHMVITSTVIWKCWENSILKVNIHKLSETHGLCCPKMIPLALCAYGP